MTEVNAICRCDSFAEEVRIALVGKYVRIADAYASVNKALKHAAIHAKRKLMIENGMPYSGILVPGGFGDRGIEGKIAACGYARLQMPSVVLVTFASCGNLRNRYEAIVVVFKVVIDMPEHDAVNKGAGGTMRLGLRETVFLTDNCKLRMGTDEKPTNNMADRRTESSAVLMQLAEVETRSNSSQEDLSEPIPNAVDNNLLAKIDELCKRGGDGKEKAAVRMEMLELQVRKYGDMVSRVFDGIASWPSWIERSFAPYCGFWSNGRGVLVRVFAGSGMNLCLARLRKLKPLGYRPFIFVVCVKTNAVMKS
uniref:CTP synthase (glutamine hydrolyzing) n=1 Tax=Parascaris equorum TaxID=6256 RepID=A0A914RMN0_PAREQ